MSDPGRGVRAAASSRRRTTLPPGLRVPVSADVLAAHGLRARALERTSSTIDVVIDGMAATLEVEPPLHRGSVESWPFGRSRAPDATTRDLLIAAADQPVVVLDRSGDASGGRVTCSAGAGLVVTTVEPEPGRVSFVVHALEAEAPDPDDVLASAIARARRRAAQRPRVIDGQDGTDRLQRLEHTLRGSLVRRDGGVVGMHEGDRLDARGEILLFHALLALNDVGIALALLRAAAPDWAADGACATLAAASWGMWRGSTLEADALRTSARAFLRNAGDARDVWGRAAAALGAVAADAAGAPDLVAALRRVPSSPREALVELAKEGQRHASESVRAAADVLHALHDELRMMPDAMRGRLSAGPALVAEYLEVSQIAVGDAVLELRVEVGPGSASLEVEQTGGGAPITVLLEPRVPGARLREARVDRTTAELDVKPDGAGMRVEVQLVVDQPRRLELVYER